MVYSNGDITMVLFHPNFYDSVYSYNSSKFHRTQFYFKHLVFYYYGLLNLIQLDACCIFFIYNIYLLFFLSIFWRYTSNNIL